MALVVVDVGLEAGVTGTVERCWKAAAVGPGHEEADVGGSPFETPDFERVCRARSGKQGNRV